MRAADARLRAHRVFVAVTELHAAFELIARILGADDDGAADGVASVHRALRSFQHFDLLDVEQLLVELRGIGFEHAVDQHRHRRLAVARLRDAAHHDEGVAGVLRFDQRHVGHARDEIGGPVDARGLDGLAR